MFRSGQSPLRRAAPDRTRVWRPSHGPPMSQGAPTRDTSKRSKDYSTAENLALSRIGGGRPGMGTRHCLRLRGRHMRSPSKQPVAGAPPGPAPGNAGCVHRCRPAVAASEGGSPQRRAERSRRIQPAVKAPRSRPRKQRLNPGRMLNRTVCIRMSIDQCRTWSVAPLFLVSVQPAVAVVCELDIYAHQTRDRRHDANLRDNFLCIWS